MTDQPDNQDNAVDDVVLRDQNNRPVRDDTGDLIITAGAIENLSWPEILGELFSNITQYLGAFGDLMLNPEDYHVKSRAMGIGGGENGPEGHLDEIFRVTGAARRERPETNPQASDSSNHAQPPLADDVLARIDESGVRVSERLDDASAVFNRQFASATTPESAQSPETDNRLGLTTPDVT